MAIKPIRVSQLNSYIKRVLQSDPLLGNVTVIGEISNLKYHGSGHVYFTLKDENSKLNCFLPSDVLKNMRYELTDGMEITASGYIYVYERGGTYSLNVRDIAIEGTGNLSIAFEKLKGKLLAEGMFDEKFKKPLPFFPKKIAVVTSETGAAVKDILKIIQSRNNFTDVLIYPCLVQGPEAAKEISRAINTLNEKFPDLDLMIVGRGGGSMEELWAFNEEVVARSIFASKIPIISAVGHETDVTIADFVADLRAETPTAAATKAVPNTEELRSYICTVRVQLDRNAEQIANRAKMRLERYNLDALKIALLGRINYQKLYADSIFKSMNDNMKNRTRSYEEQVIRLRYSLEALNPLVIMAKGYVAVTDESGRLLSSAKSVKEGQKLKGRFIDGIAELKVEKINFYKN